MSMYKAVVVGCGERSRPHIQAYQHIEDLAVEVTACYAPTPTNRDKIAAEFGLRAYDDARKMIETEQPDIVHLITWPDTRVELMTLVSELNVPLCTVEKPIATEVSDWRALCELEAVSKTKFAVCHQFRWQPHLAKCQEALASGALGEVEFIDLSAGFNISGQGTHILNYGMSLNDDAPVVRVFGTASGDSEMNTPHPAPDSTVGYLMFENGVRGLWNNGPTAPRCGAFHDAWAHVRVAAYASRGRVTYEEFGKWEIASPTGVERGVHGDWDSWMANNLLAQAAFHGAMFAWLRDETKVPGTNLKQSLHEWHVVLALYASTIEHTPINIAEFDPPEDLYQQLRIVLQN